MTTEVTITCPHCRRQYPMKIDPERLQRLKTRATCGRCGNAFDVAARVAAAAPPPTDTAPPVTTAPSPAPSTEATTLSIEAPPEDEQPIAEPPTHRNLAVPQIESIVAPPAPPPGTLEPDELAELAREFADAAARFTPVGSKSLSGGRTMVGPAPMLPPSPPPSPTVTVEAEPPSEPEPPPVAVAAPPPTTPKLSRPASPPPTPVKLSPPSPLPPPPEPPPPEPPPPPLAPSEAAPSPPEPVVSRPPASSMAELAVEADFQGSESTLVRVAVAPAPAPPRSWLELADPGLEKLTAPPSPTAALLDGILLRSPA